MNNKTKKILMIAIPIAAVLLALVLVLCLSGKNSGKNPDPNVSSESQTTSDVSQPSTDSTATDPTTTDPTTTDSHETLPSESNTDSTTAPEESENVSSDTPQLYNPDGTPELPTGQPNTNTFDIPGFTPITGAELGDMGDGLRLAAAGLYTGNYMEDGTDDPVENVIALVIENTGDQLIELSEISANCDGNEVNFQFTALPVGGYVFVLESNRKTATASSKLGLPNADQMAFINDATLDYSSDFQLYNADGVINIVNTSGKDFQNDIYVYYKTYKYNVYFGGVTYRARFSGIENEGIGQSLQEHYKADSSVVVYMAYAE